MPFQSQAQRGYLYANDPAVAKKFEAETPKGKHLPKHKVDAKRAIYNRLRDTQNNDLSEGPTWTARALPLATAHLQAVTHQRNGPRSNRPSLPMPRPHRTLPRLPQPRRRDRRQAREPMPQQRIVRHLFRALGSILSTPNGTSCGRKWTR